MGKTVFVSGGQRSGKSSYAQKQVEILSAENQVAPVYLATARIWDEDMKLRIDRHREDRSQSYMSWKTIECEKEISKIQLAEGTPLVLDCITLWLSNWSYDFQQKIAKDSQEVPKNFVDQLLVLVKAEWDAFLKLNLNCYVISNELGMGLHADTSLGRQFIDLQGFMNQYISKQADESYFMVSGQALNVK
jgi:adenosylcobinamide kinase/adenosylcobinamide-phosphate guanylyltransferase